MRYLPLILLAACADPSRPASGDDVETPASTVTAVAFTQAIGDAMWADPIAFPTIPVHVAVTGSANHVAVIVDNVETVATPDGAGRYTATIDVTQLGSGEHAIVAQADAITRSATLRIGREGIAWTQIAVDGNAGTPRVHRAGDHLYVTWTDASAGARTAWLGEIDGAGRPIGARVVLAGGHGAADVLYARTAFGASSIGVVYQQPGGPYANYFARVTASGAQIGDPIALDPADRYGSYGGDVAFADGAFDVVWRTNDGAGHGDLRWMRVDEATGAVTGPVIVAANGFDPIVDISLRRSGAAAIVAFKRSEYDPVLDFDIARCQVAVIADGAVARTERAGIGGGYRWDDDCRIAHDAAGPVIVWEAKDLESSEDDPPGELYATRATADGLLADRGNGRMLVSAPLARYEATIAGTALAWTDERTYVDLQHGAIQLFFATLAADFTIGEQRVFDHAHFIAGTAGTNGVSLGENAFLTWIDERHGGSVLDPHPEVYFETIWQ